MWQVHHEEILECHALQMNVAFQNQAKQALQENTSKRVVFNTLFRFLYLIELQIKFHVPKSNKAGISRNH